MIDSNLLLKTLKKNGSDLFLGVLLAIIAGVGVVVMLKQFVQTDGLKARPLGRRRSLLPRTKRLRNGL